MRKTVAVFSVFALFLWILPLGSFIKPSQEKTACGGSRAFHMCTMGMGQAKKGPGPQKISFTNASGAEKTDRSPSSSGGNDFINGDVLKNTEVRSSKTREFEITLPRQSFFLTPEPIPKLRLF